MRKIKKLAAIVVFAFFIPLVASAQSILPSLNELGFSQPKPIYDIIAGLTKWLFSIFGFIAIIAFLISGIQYLVAAGDEDMQKRAKRNFVYSIIGVIVGLSGVIIIYAVQKIVGVDPSYRY